MKFGELMEVSFIPDFTDRLGAYLRGGQEARAFLTEFGLEEALQSPSIIPVPSMPSGQLLLAAVVSVVRWPVPPVSSGDY